MPEMFNQNHDDYFSTGGGPSAEPTPQKTSSSSGTTGCKIKIVLPAGAFIGYDPFEHPEDQLPVDDSFKQPVNKVDAMGHIMFPKMTVEGTAEDTVAAEPEQVRRVDVGQAGFVESEFHHGLLPREDINILLETPGDFLLRTTEIVGNGNRQCCLSVKAPSGNVEHFVLRLNNNNQYQLSEDQSFPSIKELINHFMNKKQPFGNPPVTLGKPVCRQNWEFHPDQVELSKPIGEGAFGQVYIGKVTMTKNSPPVDCAIKTMKLQMMDKKMTEEIMKEARLMRMLKHKNIVSCFGVCADQEPLMIIMEFCTDGSLDKYLKARNIGITVDDRVQMVYDAASGINHCHRKGVVHRDIAARNCLYGKKVLKISDFGLSRQATAYRMNSSEKAPLKSLAPEVFLTQIYTPAADVWAFGVLVWEIFNNGADPYSGWTGAQLKHEVGVKGYRLTLPDWSPPFIKEHLVSIFDADPAKRCKLTTVIKTIDKLNKQRQSIRKKKNTTPSDNTDSNAPQSKKMDQLKGSTKKKKAPAAGSTRKKAKKEPAAKDVGSARRDNTLVLKKTKTVKKTLH